MHRYVRSLHGQTFLCSNGQMTKQSSPIGCCTTPVWDYLMRSFQQWSLTTRRSPTCADDREELIEVVPQENKLMLTVVTAQMCIKFCKSSPCVLQRSASHTQFVLGLLQWKNSLAWNCRLANRQRDVLLLTFTVSAFISYQPSVRVCVVFCCHFRLCWFFCFTVCSCPENKHKWLKDYVF